MSILLRPCQDTMLGDVRGAFRSGFRAPLLVAPTGCHAKGTRILAYDGRQIPVEDVEIGDRLMGPDSRPRVVVDLHRGIGEMYRVTPVKGEPFVVNADHLLSLIHTQTRERTVVSVREWLTRSKTFRHCHKLWRVAVEYPEAQETLPMDPYILGVFLGDGCITRHTTVCTPDQEIIDALQAFAVDSGVALRTGTYGDACPTHSFRPITRWDRDNPVRDALKAVGAFGKHAREKDIPHRYLTASREQRAALLAGLLDTDGYMQNGGYDFATASHRMAEQVSQLARSLGLAAYVSPKTVAGYRWVYWRISISGDASFLPMRVARKKAVPRRQKKDVLVTGFDVEPIGAGVYYGFECDRDHLYLTADFTVHHNSGKTVCFSYIAANASAKGNKVLILVHRQELLRQTSATLAAFDVPHGLIASGVPETDEAVQVASVQTLVRRLDRMTWSPSLIVVDEAHHCTGATGHGRILAHYADARVLGVTATPERLDGQGLGAKAGGFFDALVMGPTVSELVELGHLSKPVVYAPPSAVDLSGIRTVAGDFSKGELAAAMDKPVITGSAVTHYRRHCDGAPAIVFCSSIAHAEHVAEAFSAEGYRAASIDGTLDPVTRAQRIADLGSGALQVLTSCEIISEGTDIPIVAAAILLRPTQSLALYLQQVGRALRPYPGKARATILDHVGNCHRHGLPDDDRTWSLDSKPRRQRKKDPEETPIRQCEQCYAVHAPAPICPSCGFVYPVHSREAEEVEGDLTEVVTDPARLAAKREQAKAATLDELRKIAAERGYNPRWAEHVYRARQSKPRRWSSGR